MIQHGVPAAAPLDFPIQQTGPPGQTGQFLWWFWCYEIQLDQTTNE